MKISVILPISLLVTISRSLRSWKVNGPSMINLQPRPKSSEAGSKAEVATWMDSLHDIHALVKKGGV